MTLRELADEIGRSVPAVMVTQKKYGLPSLADYSTGYAVMMKKVIYLSILSVSLKDIKALLKSERQLLELLRVDSLEDSPDWFESLCVMKVGGTRLLISGYHIGSAISGKDVQPSLDFRERPKELFEDREMGADALLGLRRYAELLGRIRMQLRQELDTVRQAEQWGRQIASCP